MSRSIIIKLFRKYKEGCNANTQNSKPFSRKKITAVFMSCCGVRSRLLPEVEPLRKSCLSCTECFFRKCASKTVYGAARLHYTGTSSKLWDTRPFFWCSLDFSRSLPRASYLSVTSDGIGSGSLKMCRWDPLVSAFDSYSLFK